MVIRERGKMRLLEMEKEFLAAFKSLVPVDFERLPEQGGHTASSWSFIATHGLDRRRRAGLCQCRGPEPSPRPPDPAGPPAGGPPTRGARVFAVPGMSPSHPHLINASV